MRKSRKGKNSNCTRSRICLRCKKEYISTNNGQMFCFECGPIVRREQRCEWRRLRPRSGADYSLRTKYGFGVEELDARAAAQNNTCLISFLPLTKTPCVDHIGTLGTPSFVVRGLITRQANIMLGLLEGLERLGADLRQITAPHIYDYVMRGRAQQQRQLEQSRGATA
jgi:hypothetical protein